METATRATAASESPSRNGPEPASVTTAEAWANLNLHTIHLPSTAVVLGRLPDLADLILGGDLPEKLQKAAAREIMPEQAKALLDPSSAADVGTLTDEEREAREAALLAVARSAAEIRKAAVFAMVVEPAMTPELWAVLPPDDKDMLADLAMREPPMLDAKGNRIGGMPLTEAVPFREEPTRPKTRPKRPPEKRAVPRSRSRKV